MASSELTLREVLLAESYEDEAKKLRERIGELEKRVLFEGKFRLGDRVRAKRDTWQGRVCGFYSSPPLTPIGYNVRSERETNSVHIYPEAALEAVKDNGNTS